MKVIREKAEAAELISSAQREGLSAFGSAKSFLRKISGSRQNISSFRCSAIRTENAFFFSNESAPYSGVTRNIVEEALSPSLTDTLRQQMAKAAVELAEAADYNGAGTVEFLVQDGKFYFLEMNTRLQVEHPVTEMVLGIDLVKAQILTAERFV